MVLERGISLQTFIRRLDQTSGTGFVVRVDLHLVHGIAKADMNLRIGKPEGAARACVSESFRVRPVGSYQIQAETPGKTPGQTRDQIVAPDFFFCLIRFWFRWVKV